MMCTKCKVQMEVGTAIQTDNRRERSMDFCQQILNHKTLELISVWKCPKCGHSETIYE